jgi:MOSC domain-containing protein YiiM
MNSPATLLSVNLALPRLSGSKDVGVTGIDKRPTPEPVELRDPGPKKTGLGSGLVGDQIFDVASHGGEDQAVYAYAREDLDWWQAELGGKTLPGGCFGENLTTRDLDVNGALIGERWQIGDTAVLQVTYPRIPCRTFADWMRDQADVPGRWIKTFTQAARPGAYLRIVTPGVIRAGDPITVVHRPDHDVTVEVMFRAITLESELLPRMLGPAEIPDDIKAHARRRIAPYPGEDD